MGKGDKQKEESVEAMKAANVARKRGEKVKKELLFSQTNYLIIGVGLVMVIVGLFLMSGGHNDPNEWKPEVIYSFVRITVAPLVILSGLGVVIFAIFKNTDKEVPTFEG